jgi:hypothetical protein
VLSTLHSANPWMAIDRMLDAFPGPQQPQVRAQLAGVLRGDPLPTPSRVDDAAVARSSLSRS